MAASNRSTIIDAVVNYLKSTQWKDVIQVLQERDMNHFHSYVDSSIDPYDLAKVFAGYIERRGWSFYRDVDILKYGDGRVAIYAMYSRDRPSFEVYVNLRQDVVLEPTDPVGGEAGSNVRSWTDSHIRRHVNQYTWRLHSDAEVAEVKEFFANGEHWKKARELITDPDMVHIHCNIETSVHPNVIREIALADLAKRGWKIEHAHHCVFNAKGTDQGKIIFYGLEPKLTYDIVWYYNPKVVIQVNTQDTHMKGDPGTGEAFLICRRSTALKEMKKIELTSLSDDEIQKILDRADGFDTRSAFSWRIVPTERVGL